RARVSILVVLDWAPQPLYFHEGWTPQSGFQSLLSWIGLLNLFSLDPNDARIGVSILVVLDWAPQRRSGRRWWRLWNKFQSLLSWIGLLNPRLRVFKRDSPAVVSILVVLDWAPQPFGHSLDGPLGLW